jgi:hypothetical protein
MTHVRNVEAYSRLVGFCTGYGGKYNPGQPNLQLEVLQAHFKSAQDAIEHVAITKSLFDKAVNARKVGFDSLGRLAPGILLTMQASGAKPETIDDARQYVRHLTGSSKNRDPIPAATAGEGKPGRSSLTMAYTSKAEWFTKLVKAVEVDTLYKTNIAMYDKPALIEKAQELAALNKAVLETRIAWTNARVERDKILYANADSMYNSAANVKKIVRSMFGLNSLEYNQLRPVIITNPVR